MSKLKEATEKIMEGYEKIEDGVVTGYKKVEDTVVGHFNKMTDTFVVRFLTKDGEALEDAKTRLIEDQQSREAAQKARIESSLEASRNAGKRN